MTILKADTIHQLQEHLKKFDKNLPVAVFDCDRGYMSVAFKKEEKTEHDKKFQWLTFYAHETIPMYDVNTLLGYLSKLPPQAVISKQTEENQYTSLYLSIDGMTDKGKSYQWLVLSDELEYDRFFRQHDHKPQADTITKALEKMLVEMKENKSQQLELVHQWLCQQTNQELFQGILTEGKTIKGALTYCSKKALEQAQKGHFAIVEDDTVFQWIADYFIHYELPKPQPKKQTKAKTKKKAKPVNQVVKKPTQDSQESEKGAVEQQELDLFATV